MESGKNGTAVYLREITQKHCNCFRWLELCNQLWRCSAVLQHCFPVLRDSVSITYLSGPNVQCCTGLLNKKHLILALPHSSMLQIKVGAAIAVRLYSHNLYCLPNLYHFYYIPIILPNPRYCKFKQIRVFKVMNKNQELHFSTTTKKD